jgi:hypothetical protein
VPTVPPASCQGGLPLLEVLAAELTVVDVLDRLGVGLLAGGRRPGPGAGLLLEGANPVAVLARLELDARASSRLLAGSAPLVAFSNALRAVWPVRARQHRRPPLARRQRQLVGIVLAGEHHQRSAVTACPPSWRHDAGFGTA